MLVSSKPNCIMFSPNGIGIDSFESVHMSYLGAALNLDMVAS